MNSSFVGVSLRTPTATAGVGYVTVGNIYSGAAVTLYETTTNQAVSATPTDPGDGTLKYEGLEARKSYYAVQEINGVASQGSIGATVQPAIPAAPTAQGLEESVKASDYTSGATLKLYLSTSATPVATAPNVTATTYTFENVEPNGGGYYVTQTVAGEESLNSSFVGASLRMPTATAGVGYVTVGNIYPGAAVTLYEADSNAAVTAAPTDSGDGTLKYEGLEARKSYYAVQEINGVASSGSPYATVQPAIPAAPTAQGLEESVKASDYTSGATLKLYLSTGGAPVATATSVAGTTYTFENVVPNHDQYYVTQTVGGEESENSVFVNASLRTPTAAAGVGYVDIHNVYPGATVILYDYETNTAVEAEPDMLDDGSVRFDGLTPGRSYYGVQRINGTVSEPTRIVTLPRSPDAPKDVAAVAGNGQATITFTPPEEDGGAPITGYEVMANPGNIVAVGTGSPIVVTGLTNGVSYTFTVKAINAAGSSEASEPSSAVSPWEPVFSNVSTRPILILINGRTENIGQASETAAGGRSVLTLTVDERLLADKLAAEGAGAVITLPMPGGSDVNRAELNGRMVQSLIDHAAVLVVQAGQASYTLPAAQIDLSRLARQLGAPEDLSGVMLRIEIAKPTADELEAMSAAAKKDNLSIVASPIAFKVSAAYGEQSVEVTTFGKYVTRTIALPGQADAERLTTAVVLEKDGTLRHVPTKLVVADGKYFATINSLTNSLYAVVWHPLSFADVANHWAKQAVEDLGARMIVEGDSGVFDPDRDVTRAEFAAILARGLGLRLEAGASAYTDVGPSDWFAGAIGAVQTYGLIEGFEDGSFRPNDKMSREQAMTLLARAMSITGLAPDQAGTAAAGTLQTYADGRAVSDWAADSIAACLKAGLVGGRSDKLLAPQATVTRAEAATMIQRLLKQSGLI
ncbi:S-layer homology domain-containing protein [Cohnella rhizosphaerae]|uniref:S-layer homology domain-containing protein n=1 Tax=Cohnella rhizosphaerae TaxID=1457232 RepID=A0A9X4QU57_9BACL|nr:S-layer homology domain-containing protein [Cohnella rhizosphaerae]MDG0811916.1 S-layer homology domain-containing protein [Cohnella rhizosphaerae]